MAAIADDRLTRLWEAPGGMIGSITTVDHKVIGVRYIITAMLFFVLAGLEAFFIRLQLARPENTLLSPDVYNQFFTMHGTTMIFFFATPVLFGFGNFLVPLMIGARDMAFPRMNAFSFWVFLFAGLFINSSFLFGLAPNGGWFAYVPLTGPQYSPTLNMDFWALGLIFLSISSIAGAINFIVTIFKMRAPGMSINRMPLFIWALLVTSFAVIFAMPPLTTANIFLELERKIGLHFFDATQGGTPLLWQHLFWLFGHPDVYIIFLPAAGIVSEIVPTFSRRPIIGYTLLVACLVAVGVIGFGVWAHHMFAVGLSPLANNAFSIASIVIGIPSGVQIFLWLGTMITGRPRLQMPMLWIAGFVVLFVIGGLTGVMFPAVQFDRQVTDTYFIVAHFHYTLVGGAVFPIFAGVYYWFPKITGRMMNEARGKWNFWITFIGFNLTFFPMHIMGLLGMPRRIYTYLPGQGWDTLSLITAIGAVLLAIGVLLFFINVFMSLSDGEAAGDNPWDAPGLEWATASPPPAYNFRTIPTITGRDPLWRDRQVIAPVQGRPVEGQRIVEEARTEDDPTDPFRHETIGTTVLDAQPETILHMPGDTPLPILLGLALLIVFTGILVNQPALAALGLISCFVIIIAWLWPANPQADERSERAGTQPEGAEGAA